MSGQVNTGEREYLRMTFNERIQHFLLLSSFIVLILTGFGLKFPEAFWVKWIVFIIGENAFEARGIVHRIAGGVMIVASLYHLYYILFTVRGKQLVRDFWPKKQDITDFKNSMLYLIGKRETRPKFGRFSYIERMEYWAVVWGTIVMGATGTVLWFENIFLKFTTNEGMDIATAVHYYEAILASLAILVWHFYFVFLNPDVYPMNKASFKGFLTREEMEKEHPLELEEIEGVETEESKGMNELDDSKNDNIEELIIDEGKKETDDVSKKETEVMVKNKTEFKDNHGEDE
ncbi:MAG: cytochrome b/b6 domain-containing protein [Ignavibacteria bacterium]|nr:cytochrome b/b6 domain-containing protein [Ignavibacteria bacterium]